MKKSIKVSPKSILKYPILPRIFEIIKNIDIPDKIKKKNKIHTFIEQFDEMKKKNKEKRYDLECKLEFDVSKNLKSQVLKKIDDCKAIKYNCNSDNIPPIYLRKYPCKIIDEYIDRLEYMLSIINTKWDYFSIKKDSGINKKYKSKKKIKKKENQKKIKIV